MVVKSFSAKKPVKPKFLVKMEERKQHRKTLTHEKTSVARVREERYREEAKKRGIEEEIHYLREVVKDELHHLRKLNPSHPALLSLDDSMTFRTKTLRDAFQYQFIYRGPDGFNEKWFNNGVHTFRFSLFDSQSNQEYAIGYALTEEVLLDRYAREYVLKDVVRWLNRDIEKCIKGSLESK